MAECTLLTFKIITMWKVTAALTTMIRAVLGAEIGVTKSQVMRGASVVSRSVLDEHIPFEIYVYVAVERLVK